MHDTRRSQYSNVFVKFIELDLSVFLSALLRAGFPGEIPGLGVIQLATIAFGEGARRNGRDLTSGL